MTGKYSGAVIDPRTPTRLPRWLVGGLALGVLLLAGSLVAAASARVTHASGQDGCGPGRVGLTIQWADSLVTYACSLLPSSDKTPAEVLGLVVRWSDGSISTLDLPAASADASPSITSTGPPSASDTVSSRSSPSSSSTSTSPACLNGDQCTTTTTVTN